MVEAGRGGEARDAMLASPREAKRQADYRATGVMPAEISTRLGEALGGRACATQLTRERMKVNDKQSCGSQMQT